MWSDWMKLTLSLSLSLSSIRVSLSGLLVGQPGVVKTVNLAACG